MTPPPYEIMGARHAMRDRVKIPKVGSLSDDGFVPSKRPMVAVCEPTVKTDKVYVIKKPVDSL